MREKLLSACKSLSVLYCILIFINILLPDAFVISLSRDAANNSSEKLFAILRWLNCVSFVVLPIACFFKSGTFKKIAVFFCMPVAAANFFFIGKYLGYFTSNEGRGLNSLHWISDSVKVLFRNEVFRGIWAGVNWILVLLIGVGLILSAREELRWKRGAFLRFIAILAGVTILVIPIYVPQYLIGYTDILFDKFTLLHLTWVLMIIGLIVGLYYIFRYRSAQDKYILCLVLAISLLLQYNSMFAAIAEINFKRLPLQLCNIGSYLILLTLITKNKKIFYFTIVINVVGALFALAVPDVDGEGIGYLWNVHFIVEHTAVIAAPILCLALGVFPRLNKTALKHFLIGFALYFVAVLIIGTVLNGIAEITGNDYFEVNYLFMFDSEAADSLIGGLGQLFEYEIRIGNFVLRPVIQAIVFLVFNAVCLLFFGVVRVIYAIMDRKTAGSKDLATGTDVA